MEYSEFVDSAEADLALMVAAAGRGEMTDPAPTCPQFDKRALLVHIGEFLGFWTHLVCEGRGVEKTPYAELGEHDPAAWLADLGHHYIDQFRAVDADQSMWTWKDDEQHAGFAARRGCHELALHRVDLELVSGPAGPVPARVAEDGIDEVMMLAAHGLAMGFSSTGNGETLHLHGTDLDTAEWMVTIGADGVSAVREHAKGDLAIRATVSDLEMLLYQRPTTGDVEMFGDESVLGAFHRAFTFDDDSD